MAGRTERASACSRDAGLVERAVVAACSGAQALVPSSSTVLVACSGGADSTALAVALSALAREKPALALTVVLGHVDHGLRDGSSRDADLVRALAARLRVPFHHLRLSSLHLEVAREGLERAARDARHAALALLAREASATLVATAHTRRDQAETLLLRLARGAGPSQLAGVRARRRLAAGVWLVRPLLNVSRAATEALCAREGLEIVDDPHNHDEARARTRVRRLLPSLAAELNPRLEQALARAAALFAEEDELVQGLAEEALTRARRGRHEFDAAGLAALHPALLRRALLAAALEAGCRPEQGHLESVRAALAHRGARAWELHVPRGVVRLTQTSLCFAARQARRENVAPLSMELAITGPGRYAWNGRLLVLSEGRDRGTLVDETRAPFPWTLRGHRAGDRFRPGGGRAKKVADQWIDARVPRAERAALPLLADKSGILFYVGGLRAGEPSKGKLERPFALQWTSEMDAASAGLCTVLG